MEKQAGEASSTSGLGFIYSEGADDINRNDQGDTLSKESIVEVVVPVSAQEELHICINSGAALTSARQIDDVNERENEDVSGSLDVQQIVVVEPPESEESVNFGSDQSGPDETTIVKTEYSKRDHRGDQNSSEEEIAGKDEAFIDVTGRSTPVSKKLDFEESMVLIGMPENEEKKSDYLCSSEVMEDEWRNHLLIEELAHVRGQLENALTEKALLSDQCKDYKDEREMFSREVSGFHSLLQTMLNHESTFFENCHRFVDRLRQAETGETRFVDTSLPLHVMVTDCSKYLRHLKTTLDDHSYKESSLREAHALLFIKEQEMEELFAKVTELSISDDIIASYMSAIQAEFNLTKQVLIELKEKELVMMEGFSKLQEEKRDMFEELNRANEKISLANLEAVNARTALEETENKLASSRERLSIAVAKGKSLVQQRDSLRHSLSEKTNELEKCLHDLQHKSESLRYAEAKSEELVRNQNLVFSLEESLCQRNKALQDIEVVLLQMNAPEEIQSTQVLDKVRWLVDQKNIAECALSENSKAKEVLSAIGLPEIISSCKLESQIDWLGKSLSEAQNNSVKLMDEFSKSQESFELKLFEAHKEIDNLTMSFLKEKKERDLLQRNMEELTKKYENMMRKLFDFAGSLIDETVIDFSADAGSLLEKCSLKVGETNRSLEDLTERCDDLAERLSRASSEKDALIYRLLEILGIKMEDYGPYPDMVALVEETVGTIKKKSTLLEDVMHKYESLLEYSSQCSLQKDELLRKLVEVAGNSINDLRVDGSSDERESLLSRCVDVIREKIISFTETSGIIKEQFQKLQELLYVRDHDLMLCERLVEEDILDRSEMARLAAELNTVSKEVITLKGERDSLQKDIERAEEKTSAAREKLSLAVKKGKGLMHERDNLKLSIDEKNEQIQRLKNEVQQHESVIAGCKDQIECLHTNIDKISKLESDIIFVKAQRDQNEQFLKESNIQLQGVIDSVKSLVLPTHIKFENPTEKLKWLSGYIQESQIALERAEQELKEIREEAHVLVSRLEDAQATIGSMQDALSKAHQDSDTVRNEKVDVEAALLSAKQELKNVQAEHAVQNGKLADAHVNIKALQDALSHEKNNATLLINEKNEAEYQREHEMLLLNAKLSEFREELGGMHERLQSQTYELLSQLSSLQGLMRGEDMLSLLSGGFKNKFEYIKNLSVLLQDINDRLAGESVEWLQVQFGMKDDSTLALSCSFSQFKDDLDGIMISSEKNIADLSQSIPSYLTEIQDMLKLQHKKFCHWFEGLSACMDGHFADLVHSLQVMKEKIFCMLGVINSMKLDLKKHETYSQEQDNKISMLKNGISIILSASSSATQDLQTTHDTGFGQNSARPFEDLSLTLRDYDELTEFVEVADKLLTVVRQTCSHFKQLEYENMSLLARCEELQTELRQARMDAEKATLDGDPHVARASKLEGDTDVMQESCNEKLEEYQAKEDRLWEKEAELTLSYGTSSERDQGVDRHLISEGQLAILCNKISEITFSVQDPEARSSELHFPSLVSKACYIIDNYADLQHEMDALLNDKRVLQQNIDAQFDQIEHLTKENVTLSDSKLELEQRKSDLAKLADGLEGVIQMLDRNITHEDRKVNVEELLIILEKLTTGLIVDAENSKMNSHELGIKLQVSQKTEEELLSKIKVFENALHGAASITEMESIYNMPSSTSTPEILEIDEPGVLRGSTLPAVPPAAHARPLRKGSSEHLVLNIDLEPEKLVKYHEADEEKGHVFKSLNSSGFIPKQGKLIADRLDGVWVSGGRLLMSRPRARLGVIGYCLLLHIWVLVTIL